jgi:hypothetical protein
MPLKEPSPMHVPMPHSRTNDRTKIISALGVRGLILCLFGI